MVGRNRIIDIARGLGILLVVLGHNPLVWQDKGELYRVIYSFHMPLFFFLSGVFFDPKKTFLNTIVEKSDALLKPYVVVLLLLGLWGALMKGNDFSVHLWGLLQATGHTIEWAPLWFLPHLLVVIMLSWLLLRAFPSCFERGLLKWTLVGGLLLVGICTIRMFWQKPLPWLGVNHVVFGLPWSLDIVFITVSYHLIGYFCSARVRDFSPRFAEVAVAVVVFVASHVMSDQTIDLNNRKFDGYLFPVLESLSGIYLIMALSCLIQSFSVMGRALALAGTASLFVLIFHWPIQGKAGNLLMGWMPKFQTPAMLLAFCAACALPVLMWRLVGRSDHLSLLFLPFRSNKLLRKPQLSH